MRRRIRESYRLNKAILSEEIENNPEIATLSVAWVYIHDKNLPYETVEEKMKISLDKLIKRLSLQSSQVKKD